MTTTDQPLSADADRWARHRLNFDPEAASPTPAELLGRLDDWDYVLPLESAEAWRMLMAPARIDPDSPLLAQAQIGGRERRLEKELNDFASRYFQFPPGERKARWLALCQECEHYPALIRWVQQLGPGLDQARPTGPFNEDVSQLLQAGCDVFVAPYPFNARLRQQFVSECRRDALKWGRVYESLPAEARQFVKAIAPWAAVLPKLRIQEKQARKPIKLPVEKVAVASGETSGGWSVSWWLVVILISALSRLPNLFPPSKPSATPQFNQGKVDLDAIRQQLQHRANERSHAEQLRKMATILGDPDTNDTIRKLEALERLNPPTRLSDAIPASALAPENGAAQP